MASSNLRCTILNRDINKIILEYCYFPRPFVREFENKVNIKYDIDALVLDSDEKDCGYSESVIVMSDFLSKNGKVFTIEEIDLLDDIFSKKRELIENLLIRENLRRSEMNLEMNYHLWGGHNVENCCWIGY